MPSDYAVQLSLAAAWAAGYVCWTFFYHRVLDPVIRRRVGDMLGVEIVWACDARQYFQRGRYKRWHWGVADAPVDRVVFTEFIVRMLCLAFVTVLAGLWPIALLYVALVRRWASPLTLYACVLLAIPMFSVYWGGRFRPPVR